MSYTQYTNSRIIRMDEVENKTGLKRSSVYKLISENSFPQIIKLGKRASGWIESEVDEWIQKRITESRKSTTQAA